MRLYSYWRSSSAWRVRLALAYKGIPHEVVPIHLLRDGGEQHHAAFRTRNPLGQVPVLELPHPGGPLYLTQSMAIIEYLEEVYPKPALLPGSLELRAHARELAQVVNSGIQPFQNLSVQQSLKGHGLDPVPLVRSYIEAGLAALQTLAEPSIGRYLVGDELTLADVYLVPQLYAARRLGVDVDAYPTLRRIEQNCEELESFKVAHPDAQVDKDV